MEKKFEKFSFSKRLSSMIKVDFRRMFTTKLFYIVIGCCFIAPILIFIMTSMMEGSPMNDQHGNPILDKDGNPVLMEGFKNVWQMLGSTSNSSGMSFDITSMCNINLLFIAISVLICIFISSDFKSGYCKNLFTLRSNKVDYVISKIIIGFVSAISMFIIYFAGMLIGGKIAGISFALPEGVNIGNVIMSFVSKLFLSLVFVSIFVTMSLIGKQKTWLCLVLSLAVSMLLFMMISAIAPLDATFINVILSLVGGVLFATGLGIVGNTILKKTSLI